MNPYSICISAVLPLLFLLSCKKNKTPAPELKTYLASSSGPNVTYNYFYDAQNRLQRMQRNESGSIINFYVTAYDASNNITEVFLRSTSPFTSKYTHSYDAQNRVIKTEIRDSINPTTFYLVSVLEYSYTTRKCGLTIKQGTGVVISSIVWDYDGDGNQIQETGRNAAGATTYTRTFSNFDNKINVNKLRPAFIHDEGPYPPAGRNNHGSSVWSSGASTVNYTVNYTYNADGYPLQITEVGGSVAPYTTNYTYGKR
jgi:hypothetical protein